MNHFVFLPSLLALLACVSCTKIEGTITSTGDTALIGAKKSGITGGVKFSNCN